LFFKTACNTPYSYLAGKLHLFLLIMATKSVSKSFPWLALLGTFFALMLCITVSGMVFVVYPQSSRLIRLFFSPDDSGAEYLASVSENTGEPTPFQPLLTEIIPPTPTTLPEAAPTAQPTAEPTKQPTPILEPKLKKKDIPASSYISGVYGSPQLYTLDCESQAAVDWARYFGVGISEHEFIDLLPQSDDPDEGFVGNINGPMGQIPPGDYGVYPGPVAELLRAYGLNARAVSGLDIKSLKREIAEDRPVIVWIVNLPFAVKPSEYTASNGHTTIVAPFQHTWIVTGYNGSTFTVIDSEWTYNVIASTFIERWNVLGNRAVIMGSE